MIDIHCHLIPQIDDGSESLDTSLGQLRLMQEGGIEHVFLTSHYMGGSSKFNRETYDSKFQQLQNSVSESGVKIGLHPGFEVFLHPHSVDEIVSHNLVLGSSRYVLLESDLNGLTDDFYNYVYPILRKGYKPILAHAERYVSIMNKPKEAKHLIDRDIYIQVNTGSLIGQYGEKVRQTAWLLLRNGWAHVLASDDHGRTPFGSYFAALDQIKSDLDQQIVNLLTNEHPADILHNRPIPYKYVYLHRTHSHRRRKRNLWQRIFG